MSALLSFLASAVPAVINGVTDALGMQGQAHYQRVNMRESARLQHEENKYWAEYSTPSAQMARLKAAGLNPNLVYGNGADAQFSGSVSPSGGMPHMKGGYGTDFLTASNIIAQNKNLQAQNDVLKNESELKKQQARSQFLDNLRKEAASPSQMGSMDNLQKVRELRNLLTENERIASQKLLNDAMREYNIAQTDISKQSYDFNELANAIKVASMNIELDNLPQKIANDLKVSEAQARQLLSQAAANAALKGQYQAMAKYYDSLDEQTKQSTEGVKLQNDIKKVEKQIKDNEKILSDYDVEHKTTWWSSLIDYSLTPLTNSVGHIFGASLNIGALLNK